MANPYSDKAVVGETRKLVSIPGRTGY